LAVKDLFDAAGVRTTCGSAVFREHIPSLTAEVVVPLEAAGYASVGKTNLHEFAYGVTSDNEHFGRVPVAIRAGFGSIANGVTTTSLPLLPIRVSKRKRMSSAMQPVAERSRVQPADRRDPDVANSIASLSDVGRAERSSAAVCSHYEDAVDNDAACVFACGDMTDLGVDDCGGSGRSVGGGAA
jgi:hypothetical protein